MNTLALQDMVRAQGYVRLQNHRLNPFLFRVVQFLNWIGAVRLAVRITHKYGVEKWNTGFMKNTNTNAAKAAISGLVGNTGAQNPFTYIAVGSSSTAPAASQTTLGAEYSTIGLSRAAATVSRVTTNQTNDTLRLLKQFSVSGTGTVEEAGVFNASSVGVMLGRALTGSKSLVSGDTLTITYDTVFA